MAWNSNLFPDGRTELRSESEHTTHDHEHEEAEE